MHINMLRMTRLVAPLSLSHHSLCALQPVVWWQWRHLACHTAAHGVSNWASAIKFELINRKHRTDYNTGNAKSGPRTYYIDPSKTASKGRDVVSKTASRLGKRRDIAQKRRYRERWSLMLEWRTREVEEIERLTLCLRSFWLENELTNAWAWVPLTGIPNSFPASTLLVPSKPDNYKTNRTITHTDSGIIDR